MVSSIQVDNSYATTLQQLHTPGHPVVFANIYDPASAASLLSLNAVTQSPIRAEPHRDRQDRAASLPLSADLQDSYGAQLVEVIQRAVALSVVGANIEDSYPEKGNARGMECLRTVEEQAERLKLAKETADADGVG